MSDVLLNFTGNTDNLQPVVDVLDQIIAKSGKIGEQWKQVVAAMNAGNTNSAQGTNKLVESTDKLAESIDQVEQGQKSVAAQAKTTTAAIDIQNKTGTEGTNKLSKSIVDLATASKSLDKSIIGGAYKNYLKQIQDQLGLTNKEVIAYVQNARKAAQEAILSSNNEQEIKELSLTIDVMNDQLKQLGVNEDGTSAKTQTLRERIREVKDELVAMAEAGKMGTPEFTALQEKAGELDDQWRDLNTTIRNTGSDTKNIDGLISLMGGVAGGYAVAQGAAALFGSENEDVQKALLKVNAAMSILQGLQQIQNVLQKESAANILLGASARTAQATAVAAETTAEIANTAATEAATVATKGLNTAMLANPALAVIVGVLALVTALDALNSANHLNEELQSKINNTLKEAGPILDGYIDSLQRQTNLLLANAKLSGASVNQITKLEAEASNKRLALIKEESNALAKQYNDQIELFNKVYAIGGTIDKETLEAHDKLLERQLELDKQYAEERNALEVKALEFRKKLQDDEIKSYASALDAAVALTVAGSDKEREVRNAAIKATQADRIQAAKEQGATAGEIAKIIADDERAIEQNNLQNYQHYLQGKTALDEAYLAAAKFRILQNETDSVESINRVTDLEIAAAKRRRDEALSDPTLNTGQREKIVQQSNLEIAELEKQKEQKILDIQQSGINARLIAAKKRKPG